MATDARLVIRIEKLAAALVSKADLHVTGEITFITTDRVYLFARVIPFSTVITFAKLAMQVVQLVATRGFKTVLNV